MMLLDRPLRETLASMHRRIGKQSSYLGIPTMKCPEDFWSYQEIIHETRPDFVVEVGNFHGGALLAYAHLLDAVGHGRVIGVDIAHGRVADAARSHPRVTLVTGDAATMFPHVEEIVGSGSAFVIEDSSHTFENTIAVLRAYSKIVRPGHYIVVEDGIYNGNGIERRGNDGAADAVDAFLAENPCFEADERREWPVTWNPGGYLRRTG